MGHPVGAGLLDGDGRGWSVEGLLAELVEEGCGEVALAGAGDDDYDQFAGVAGFLRNL
jgi:hypothetical protein